MGIPKDIALQDFFEIQNLVYDWAESYDTKDWERLEQVLGPAVRLDLRKLNGPLQENLTPDQFATIISDKKLIGDPCVKTQHLLGAGSWSSPGDGTVQVWWQLRAVHVRFATEDMAVEVNHANGAGVIQHTYKKFNGAWKIIGIVASHNWTEGDLWNTLNPAG